MPRIEATVKKYDVFHRYLRGELEKIGLDPDLIELDDDILRAVIGSKVRSPTRYMRRALRRAFRARPSILDRDDPALIVIDEAHRLKKSPVFSDRVQRYAEEIKSVKVYNGGSR